MYVNGSQYCNSLDTDSNSDETTSSRAKTNGRLKSEAELCSV